MDNVCIDGGGDGSSVTRYRRQRFMSCPSINENVSARIALIPELSRRHRPSQIDESGRDMRSVVGHGKLKTSSSDSTAYGMAVKEIGVRSFDNWRPRRNSSKSGDVDGIQTIACRATFALNEDRLLDAMNLDTKLVTSAAVVAGTVGVGVNAPWYKEHFVGGQQGNPFRSDLFLRVLYLIGSANAIDTEDDARNDSGDNASAIQQQFLSDEQIMENQLKEQLGGVERLRHELAGGDTGSCKSGTVTPAEFIYQSIPNIIKRNSFSNFKVEPESAPAFVPGHKGVVMMLDHGKLSSPDLVDHHQVDSFSIKRESSHKLTGMEKCMLAPLTF